MSSSDPAADPLGDLAPALRRSLEDVTVGAAALATDVGRSLDDGRLPLVLPAAVLATRLAGVRPAAEPGPDAASEPAPSPEWLLDELEWAYGGRSRTAWDALVRAGCVEIVALDDPGTEPPAPLAAGVPVRRVALPAGQRAVHPRSPWPSWIRLVGGGLVGVAAAVLLWSYDVAPWIWLLTGAVLAVVYASVEAGPVAGPGRRASVATWAVWRRQAAVGAALFGSLSLAVGLLALDGLVARDGVLVVVPLVLAGAWVGGGDLLAALAAHQRGGRRTADLGSTRVLAEA